MFRGKLFQNGGRSSQVYYYLNFFFFFFKCHEPFGTQIWKETDVAMIARHLLHTSLHSIRLSFDYGK